MRRDRRFMKDFFISYNQADKKWATWIADTLENAGYRTVIQEWDFGAGSHIGVEMDRALEGTSHTLLVLSDNFLKSDYCKMEFGASATTDPAGSKRRVLPVRVANCQPRGLIAGIDYIDLVDKPEAKCRDILLGRIAGALTIARGGRAKPDQKAPFPGPEDAGVEARPAAVTAGDLDIPFLADPAHAAGSRAPLVIALEEAGHPLSDVELLRTERHLTVSLGPGHLSDLREIASQLSPTNRSLVHVWEQGRRIWRILELAQPQLKHLLRVVADSRRPQPVAWTGRTALLVELHRLLLLAHTGPADDANALLSVGFGAQYFHPIGAQPGRRTMQPRSSGALEVGRFHFEEAEGGDATLARARASDACILTGKRATDRVRDLSEIVRGHADSRLRLAIGFGPGDIDAAAIEQCLSRLPCVSLGGPGLGEASLITTLQRALERLASRQAAPCLLAAARRAWLKRAQAQGDVDAFLDGLAWSTWSWIGRPLFADQFGALEPAAYPHLMDLRSVAAKEWYFNRRKGIPECYEADTLARSAPGEQTFHLYLSGAGGTGKSCFLRYIYEKCASRPDMVAVWYRVDAPSSEWEEVEKRLQEELCAAVRAKLGDDEVGLLPAGGDKLSSFLVEAAERLRESRHAIRELVIFVDQLERTFESGDEPDYRRLESISFEMVDLLKTVKAGQGIRVFIASRKQYLPDFLRSSRDAEECRLQFNVLQAISDRTEQVGFVQRVLRWCQEQRLVGRAVSLDHRAAETLAGRVNGHPLNLMLALIEVFARGPQGEITEQLVEESRPWEKLFDLDLQVAAKDDIDWFFVLSMAHARTEIVRFEEVWWRLRMINPTLTRRVDELRPQGVLERLWLLGYLGKTLHPRPYRGDPARFLEFFHANLRDYLLRVMGQGGADLELQGRRCETPLTWRALDRLSVAAHEWEQRQQLLPREDVACLMDHREVVVERTRREGEPEREPFYLLFLRDSEKARPQLCGAARECFAFSALVHDLLGRWAIEQLIPGPDQRIDCCRRWLQRCSEDNRAAILGYLIEMKAPKAREAVAAMVLGGHAMPDTLWRNVAEILSRPLFAARYRTEIVSGVLEAAIQRAEGARPAVESLPARAREFVGTACAANRDELVDLLSDCVARFKASPNADLRGFADRMAASEAEPWLEGVAPAATLYSTVGIRESPDRPAAPVELLPGAKLASAITADQVDRWRAAVSERLGIPLPDFAPAQGEVEEDELELRLFGVRVAVGKFHPSRVQILKRHWDQTQAGIPADTTLAHNDALQEVVLWVEPAMLAQIGWQHPASGFEEAVITWLEQELRASVDHYFGFDLLQEFLNRIATLHDSSRLFHGVSLQGLRQVVVNLVQERAPLSSHRAELVSELQQLVGEVKDTELLTEKLRERLRDPLCRQLADDAGQLKLLTLEEGYEQELANQVRTVDGLRVLRVPTEEALALASAVMAHFERQLREDARPALACIPRLRLPLARLIRRFDPRLAVLSFTELSPEVVVTLADVVILPTRKPGGPRA